MGKQSGPAFFGHRAGLAGVVTVDLGLGESGFAGQFQGAAALIPAGLPDRFTDFFGNGHARLLPAVRTAT